MAFDSPLWSLLHILLLLGGTLLLYCLGLVVYNVFFHPLNGHPGPRYLAASDIPRLISLYHGYWYKWSKELHDKYGNIVRIGPNDLSIIDSQVWKDGWSHKADFPKDLGVLGKFANGLYHITNAPGEYHVRLRKGFNPAFSERALRKQEPLLLRYADSMVSMMKRLSQEDPDHKVNMVECFDFTTFDIMAEISFGESLHLLESSENAPWVRGILDFLKYITYRGLAEKIPILRDTFEWFVPKKLKDEFNSHFQYSAGLVDRRLAKGTRHSQPDIWSFVLNQKENEGLTIPEMHTNATNFMVAGSETTASTLDFVTYLLLTNPKQLEKAVREVRTSCAESSDITFDKLNTLEYLGFCIDETLRLFPQSVNPRFVPPSGAKVCEQWMPGGTSLHVPLYAAHHSARHFQQPDRFVPERWMSSESDFVQDDRASYQPFAYGPRSCIGRQLAHYETRLLLAKTLWHFDLELCKESRNWSDLRFFTIWEKKPLMATLTPVKMT